MSRMKISFVSAEGENVGSLIEQEDGSLSFSGRADKSAELMFDNLIRGHLKELNESAYRETLIGRRLECAMELLRDIKSSHGVMLMSWPPQDPWINNRIDARIDGILRDAAEADNLCAHDWVEGHNEKATGIIVCSKCHRLSSDRNAIHG
jgi:hypothetical protein